MKNKYTVLLIILFLAVIVFCSCGSKTIAKVAGVGEVTGYVNIGNGMHKNNEELIATDVSVEVGENETVLRYTIDGVAYRVEGKLVQYYGNRRDVGLTEYEYRFLLMPSSSSAGDYEFVGAVYTSRLVNFDDIIDVYGEHVDEGYLGIFLFNKKNQPCYFRTYLEKNPPDKLDAIRATAIHYDDCNIPEDVREKVNYDLIIDPSPLFDSYGGTDESEPVYSETSDGL